MYISIKKDARDEFSTNSGENTTSSCFYFKRPNDLSKLEWKFDKFETRKKSDLKICVGWLKKSLGKKPCFQQGCQMAYFRTKNTYLGEFWRVLYVMNDVDILSILHLCILLIYYISWSILLLFGIFCSNLVHVHFSGLFVYFSRFGKYLYILWLSVIFYWHLGFSMTIM
jgi:hypothetical protein